MGFGGLAFAHGNLTWLYIYRPTGELLNVKQDECDAWVAIDADMNHVLDLLGRARCFVKYDRHRLVLPNGATPDGGFVVLWLEDEIVFYAFVVRNSHNCSVYNIVRKPDQYFIDFLAHKLHQRVQ